ncbi:sensor domain-containing diguanylate cyclase [Paenisporosarcina quisquiliarum]|uniref:Sensor domain-containing diguanylate cyclase n=1 Tax=Paenisporosarcina quisquiliarum TaxID=365346 RepID=A0A9X3LF02_9BACL|nr:sensor domain-containing diguanylate cyclase [Paenisporosarcina quisquiliarum]MCZ8536185.1 sensor domain-containing diguanylate cyclase [Paenisporosarcina quisquiliarum]
MDISKRTQRLIWAIWVLVVPFGLYSLYHFATPSEINWPILLGYTALAIITTYFPFKVAGTTLFLVQWINLAIFLKYGAFVESIVMQLAIIPLAMQLKIGWSDFYRALFNSFMFFMVSAISGVSVLLMGYQIGTLNIHDIILFGCIYQILNTFTNHVILHFYLVLTKQEHEGFFGRDSIWDYAGLIVTFPFGIMLYLLIEYVGPVAFLLLGIPFLIMTFLVRLYSNSERVNEDLNQATEIGHELADRLSGDAIKDLFLSRISKMLPVDYSYIIDIDQGNMYFLKSMEKDINVDIYQSHEELLRSIAGIVYKKDKSILFNKQKEWRKSGSDFLPMDAESIISVPISRNQKMEGIFVIASRKKYAFETYQLQIISLLCSYFAVSLEKARYVQDAVSKSERCGLTKLYNYRYLDQQLEINMNQVLNGELRQLSLLMMDIDHFKSINDAYGHQSGNDILFGLARLLEKELGDSGTIARYGGEEFVVILPNYSKEQSLVLAEELREKIESTPFEIQTDLADQPLLSLVNITISIGVSTAPEDCDDAMALIRNADRALYIGAKREGRNRVAEYVK